MRYRWVWPEASAIYPQKLRQYLGIIDRSLISPATILDGASVALELPRMAALSAQFPFPRCRKRREAQKPKRANLQSGGQNPLARSWAGVNPNAGVWVPPCWKFPRNAYELSESPMVVPLHPFALFAKAHPAREILDVNPGEAGRVKIFSLLKVQVFFVIFTKAPCRLRKKRVCEQSSALLCKT